MIDFEKKILDGSVSLLSVIFESVKKLKIGSKVSWWSKKSFPVLRRSENDTFESVIIESVKIKSVCVSAHCLKMF